MTDAATVAFMGRVSIGDDASRCWVWTGSRHSGGYGVFYFAKRRAFAHRWAYERFVGPIPAGLTIDHCCHNADSGCEGGKTCAHRLCVNPNHLEAVTNGANVLRGKSSSANRARQTLCQYGHALAGPNLRVDPKTGHRRCKQCETDYRDANRDRYREIARLYQRRRYARQKAEA